MKNGLLTVDELLQLREDRLAREARKAAGIPEPEPEAPPPPPDDPPGLEDVIGNAIAVRQIRVAVAAHKARAATGDKAPFPHVLLSGPGGTGKSMLASIVAHEIGRPIRRSMGQALNSPAGVADLLLSLKAGDVLFIDEVHGLKPACQEALYLAMEERILVPIVKRGEAPAKPVRLPAFTLIAATTDEDKLRESFIQRFGYRLDLERLTAPEIAQALGERAKRKGLSLTADAAAMIAARSQGTPRRSLALLRACIDMALSGGVSDVDALIVQATCENSEIDALGLDRAERRYLRVLESAAGGPVKLNVLATMIGSAGRRVVETRIEPTLLWLGLITKDADGRRLTAAGREHLRKENRP